MTASVTATHTLKKVGALTFAVSANEIRILPPENARFVTGKFEIQPGGAKLPPERVKFSSPPIDETAHSLAKFLVAQVGVDALFMGPRSIIIKASKKIMVANIMMIYQLASRCKLEAAPGQITA